MLGLDDLEIERGVLDLVATEVLSGHNAGGAHEREEENPENASKHGDPRLGGADQQLRCIVPEALQLVEGAGLRVKQMDYEVHEVEQNPPAAGEALDVMRVVALAVELVHDRFRDAADMGIRRSGRDDEEVGGVRQAPQVEYHELTALQIVDGIERQAQGLRDLGSHWAGP